MHVSLLKFCCLDPLPAAVLKYCFDLLLPVLTYIINLSLSTGFVPDTMKIAVLIPTLKKPDDDFAKYDEFPAYIQPEVCF